MTSSDDSILAVLARTDAALHYRALEVNCHRFNRRVSYNTVKRRMPKLLKAELVEPYEHKTNYFVISEKGRKYLQGDHYPPELDEIDED